VVTADLAAPDLSVLESAVHGADAVLSGLGPPSAADAGITAPGAEAVIRAMQATGMRRVVVVSAAPVGTVPSPGRPKPPRHDPSRLDGHVRAGVQCPQPLRWAFAVCSSTRATP
jgi:NAD(P)H-binding